jgi:UDP-N-acetylglucosamine 2-epimerase (non-hydrolysing)
MPEQTSTDLRLRIIVVIGTRPEAIKMFPVVHALTKSALVKPYVVLTGQHTDLCDQVMRMAGIEPDARLPIVRSLGTVNELSSQVTARMGELITRLKAEDTPDENTRTIAGFVHGDTTSAMAAALALAQADVPVVHVEAGLRTYNPRGPFPEELNRQVISRLALVQIAPTMRSDANLIREMVAESHTYVSGNTGIDALLWATEQPVEWSSPELEEVATSGAPLIVATLHRRENWPNLAEIAGALNTVTQARPDVRIVLPMHPNPAVRDTLKSVLGSNPNVLLVDALGYVEFAHLLNAATLAITDSGGIQEEAPSAGTPVLVVREETERMEGVEAGTLHLVGTHPERIAAATLELLENPELLAKMASAPNPFGDGHAAERIAALTEFLVSGGTAPASFGSSISRAAVLAGAGYPNRDTVALLSDEDHDDQMSEHSAAPGHVRF